MNIKFGPNNVVIKLCMSGTNLEYSGNVGDATTMGTPSDKGPFYHGTKADLQVGDF